ncbi:hypothetical protein B0F87_11562 [Methylobacter tundripaludum]|uniref:Uncharacterized protein n=1 Tax=Methylobacter tundripaludum TaxID=173365 RepID=A0A2S6H6J4_9GAMM|nr:hypothetical protein B0F87_11562 [Methylobacter tundripaludum]
MPEGQRHPTPVDDLMTSAALVVLRGSVFQLFITRHSW